MIFKIYTTIYSNMQIKYSNFNADRTIVSSNKTY